MKSIKLSFPTLIITTIAIVSFVFFLSFKWVNRQWQYNIASDGKGYYVYLPAAFIYHDFTFKFTDQIEAKYNPGNVQPTVAELPDGRKLNKYFCGEAILVIPFFLVAHFLSYLLGYDTDGYSVIYQASMSIAAIFYALAGLYMLSKLLKHFIVSQNIITYILVIVFGGSTLLHYTWMEPSMSHVYSFFAMTTFLSLSADFLLNQQKTKLVFMFVLLGIVCLIRPVNVLIVLFLPMLWLLVKSTFKIKHLLNSVSTFTTGLFLFFSIVFIQLFLYKLQIGAWWIWAYNNEGFNFNKPHFFEFIFSFRKGWLIYTPVALLSIISALYVWRKNLKLLLSFLVPLIIVVYVASSWHDWVYGASFGSRPMTEFIGIVIIPLALCFELLKNILIKAFIVFISWCFILLNCVQVYQINKHILLWDNMTFKAYRASFLKTSDLHVNMLE